MPKLSLSGSGVLTLGMIAAFLQLSRSFIMPLSQVSQQLASIAMAMAGAERIFALIDETSEVDDGQVTLVNVEGDEGHYQESIKRTGAWAWKQPQPDGGAIYTLALQPGTCIKENWMHDFGRCEWADNIPVYGVF